MAEPTLLEQARFFHDASLGACVAKNDGIALVSIRNTVDRILRHLEERHEAASEPAPPTVSIHQLTIAPGGWAKLPDGRHVQNLADVVIVVDVRENTVRAPAAAVPGALDLDELQTLCDAATPAPWELDSCELYVLGGAASPLFTLETDDDGCEAHEASLAAARFVIAARDAVPKLIAEVRRLQAELDHTDKRLRWETTKNDSERVQLERELFGGEHG